MKIIPTDVETTARSPYPLKKNGKPFGAWPFCGANEIVLIGYGDYEDPSEVYAKDPSIMNMWEEYAKQEQNLSDVIIATCNGKFDFHYIKKKAPNWYRFWIRLPVWDVQIAEFILSGQVDRMISLDELEAKYGLPTKVSEIKEHFEAGGGADTCDRDKLTEYLRGDILGTYGVAKAQMARANPKQIKLILQMGEAMKAAAEMEWNGFEVNKNKLWDLERDLINKIMLADTAVTSYMSGYFAVPEEAINLNSDELWRVYLFGGVYNFKWQNWDGYYKTGPKAGQPKPKNITETKSAPARYDSEFWCPAEKTPTGLIKIDEGLLERIGRHEVVISQFAEYKKLSKILNTYVLNIKANCGASWDGRLHHNLNLTTARNARLSCSDPNMQNVPTEATELRACFESRWGTEGVIVEADFKALEMVGFATVNPDPVLIDDLNSGRDPHVETGKLVFDHEMSETERRQVKGVNFGTIYGGGKVAVAANAGIDVALCAEIQKALKKRYAKAFEVAKSRQGLNVIEPVATGRRYVVNGEYTKTMNYPVSGFSTGDLVPTVQGVLWRKLQDSDSLRDSCLLINQEHDKFIFDVRVAVLDEALRFIRETMEASPEIMDAVYGVKMPCRTPVSIKVGPNMGEMQKV